MAWKTVASKALGSTHVLELLLEQRSQSVSNNTSIVAYEMRIRRVTSNAGGYWSNGTSSASLTLNGSNISVANFKYDFRSNYTKVLASGTRTIGHNNDGTKTVSISGSVRMDPNGRLPNGSTSGSLSLTTIARKSTFTSPGSYTMGNAFTVSISRAASSFTHTVQVHYGNTLIHSSNGHTTSASVAVNHSQLYNLTPSVSSATLKITVTTYNGSTHIGSNTRNITANNNLQPSFSGFSVSDTDSVTVSKIGAYVQSRSRLNISINGSSPTTGASIRTYRIEVDKQQLNAQSGTTQPIKSSGSITIKGTIIDSRGKSYSRSQTVNVLPYTPPTVTSVKFYRTDSKGVANDYGTYAKFEMGYRITPLNNKNSKGVKVQVGSNNTNKTPTTYSGTHTELFGGFDVSLPYNISFYVADLFGSTTSPQVLPTGAVTMMWGRDWVSVGTAEGKGSGTLNVQKQIYQNGGSRIIDFNSFPDTTGIVDFNDFWFHYVFVIPSSANVTNSRNSPPGASAGRLEVYSLGDYTDKPYNSPWMYTWQTYTDLNGAVFTRSRNTDGNGNGSWSHWCRVLTTDDRADYIIEQTIGNPSVTKWASGKMVLEGTTAGTTNSSGDISFNYDETFSVSIPKVFLQPMWNQSPSYTTVPHGHTLTSCKIRCLKMTDGSTWGSFKATVSWQAHGRWK